MISLNLNQKRSIHLLGPYRPALFWQARHEGFGRILGDEAPIAPPDPEDLTTALQLLLLGERASLNGPYNDTADLDLSALAALDIVDVKRPSTTDMGWDPSKILDWRDIYVANARFIDEHESFILAELSAFDINFPWYLLRLYVAACTGNHYRIELLKQCIPPEHKQAARHLLDWAQQRGRAKEDPEDSQMLAMVDLPLIDAICQVRHAFTLARRGEANLAGGAISAGGMFSHPDIGQASHQIWKIVINEAAAQELEFPVPTSLLEVTRLRALPEVADFREFVFPFLDAAATGDVETFSRLRNEVCVAARHIRRLPVAKRVISWATYISLTFSAVEAVKGMIGPSLITGIVGVGLEQLAKSWEKHGTWLYLSRH